MSPSSVFFILVWCFCLCCRNTIAGTFTTTQIGPKPPWNETVADRLKKDLLSNYDKYARPEHHSNATELQISITVLHVEMDEKKATMIVHSWLRLMWTDSKLKWNDADYDGVGVIRVGDHEVWQPDLCLYNTAAAGDPVSRFGSRNVLLYSEGKVLWVPPIKLFALCELNLRYWPFDTQKCFLKFGSWTNSDETIHLTENENVTNAELESTIDGSSWTINITSKVESRKYDCCFETYSSVLYNFELTRKSGPYCTIIVTPAVVCSFFILMQFWLPPHSGEKIILNAFTFLILNLFLLYFNHQVIGIATEPPLIVLYYSNTLYLVAVSLTMAVAGYTFCRLQKQKPLPDVLKKLLQGKAGKWLLLDVYFSKIPAESVEEMKDHQVTEFEPKNVEEVKPECFLQMEWILAFIALDRILFLIYSIVLFGLSLTFA